MSPVTLSGVLKQQVAIQKNVNLDDLPPNLLFEVEQAGDRLLNKAHQLISNKTTNFTECCWFEQKWMEENKSIESSLVPVNIDV